MGEFWAAPLLHDLVQALDANLLSVVPFLAQ